VSQNEEQGVSTQYKIESSKKVQKQLEKIDYTDRERIKKKVRGLGTNPRPNGAEKLKGYTEFYKIRIGKYRVIYEINDSKLLVLVLKVAKRETVYDDLELI
jgi:mRNA interferase RelE/StbE